MERTAWLALTTALAGTNAWQWKNAADEKKVLDEKIKAIMNALIANTTEKTEAVLTPQQKRKQTLAAKKALTIAQGEPKKAKRKRKAYSKKRTPRVGFDAAPASVHVQ